MRRVKFPNLFIIGAMKAGTSSLHDYLNQHPAIFMSRFKEPQYFAPHLTRWGQDWGQGNRHPEPGIAWYLRLFDGAGNARYAGESSVSYTAAPWVTGCHERIHDFNPDAKLIYLMRDPIERTLSHYWHFVIDGREDLDMREAIARREDYTARSHYARQLRPYLETFGRARVLAVTLEELERDPVRFFRVVFAFLDLEPVPIDTSYRQNVTKRVVNQTRRGCVRLDTLRKHWQWKGVWESLPAGARQRAEWCLYRSVDRAAVDARPAVEYLRPLMQEQTRELSSLVGRSFPEWRTLHATEIAEPPMTPLATSVGV